MDFKDKLLKYTTFALVLLSPLMYWSHRLYPHISSKTFFIYALIEMVFFTWLYSAITDKSYRMSKKILIWFIPSFVFVVWMTIAGIFGYNFSSSFWSTFSRGTGLLTLYHSFALSIALASVVCRYGKTFISSLFQWFIAGGVIGSISVWMGPGGFNFNIIVLQTGGEGGIMGNSSLAAIYIVFAIIFSLYLFVDKDSDKKLKKWLMVALCIMLFSPLFINISGLFNGHGILGTARGSVATLPVIAFLSFIFYLILSSKKSTKTIGITFAVIGVLIFSYSWMQLVTPGTFLHNKFGEVARGNRFIFWDTANVAMHKHPLLGYGPENYSIAFQENFNPDILLDPTSPEGWADRAHNIYFDLGVSGGYPAVILYALFIITILFAVYKSYRIGKITRFQSSILGSLVIGYIFQNLFIFESNISVLALSILSAVLFGLSGNYSYNKINNSKKSIEYLIIIPVLILFGVTWVFFAYMPARKSKLFAETFASLVSQNTKDYSKLGNGIEIGNDFDLSGLAYDAYRLYVDNARKIKENEETRQLAIKNLDPLLKYLYEVSNTNKTDYRLYTTIVYLENTRRYFSGAPYLQGEKEKLLSILDKAKSLSPTNPNIYWNIAQIKIWAGDFKGTEEAYREGIKIAPHLPGSYSLFMTYAKAIGNQKLFDEISNKAKENIKDFKFN